MMDSLESAMQQQLAPPRTLPGAPAGQAALRHLFVLRCCTLATVLVLVAVATAEFEIALPLPLLVPGLAALAAYTGYTAWLLRQRRTVGETELFWQLVVDLQLITYLLYFSGGHENPFAPMYFVPLALAAAYLRSLALLVAAIMLSDLLLMHLLNFEPLTMIDGGPVPSELMKAGVDVSYLLTASGLTVFVSRLAAAAHEQAAALARAREQQLNDQLVVGFGTLAAGAAHELATPLSSISLLAAELKGRRAPLKEGLETIAAQAQLCRQTLRNLVEAAQRSHGQIDQVATLDRFLEATAARFDRLRPDARLQSGWEVPSPAPLVREDVTLAQSLITLLNNAAEASPGEVSMLAAVHEDTLRVEVADRGPGIPPALAARLGRPFVTTRGPDEGMGMGLFLAKTSVERLGGALAFSARRGGGTRVTMTLPLAAIQA